MGWPAGWVPAGLPDTGRLECRLARLMVSDRVVVSSVLTSRTRLLAGSPLSVGRGSRTWWIRPLAEPSQRVDPAGRLHEISPHLLVRAPIAPGVVGYAADALVDDTLQAFAASRSAVHLEVKGPELHPVSGRQSAQGPVAAHVLGVQVRRRVAHHLPAVDLVRGRGCSGQHEVGVISHGAARVATCRGPRPR